MINLRGEIIPVYSLRSRFHMDEIERGKDTQLLIAKAGRIQLAFEVDAVLGIETVTSEQKNEVPIVLRADSTNYMESILNIRDKIVVEISVANIMTESEWEDIEQLIKEHS